MMFLLNNNGVLLQLSDDDGNAIELPSQGAKEFPRFLDGGIATENTDPAAYRATHSYLFSFAGSDTVYTLTVAGSAHEVDLLRNTLANVFIILFFSYSYYCYACFNDLLPLCYKARITTERSIKKVCLN